MKSVIICEKPSQAKNIQMAVGSKYGKIVPMRGHIVELKEPEDVKDDWKRWSTDLLWPGEFYGTKVSQSARSVFNSVKDALSDADQVIVATDCDREGQLIADEVLRHVRFKGKVLRAMFNAEDAKTLQNAFDNLKPNSDYENLYYAGLARQQADQVSNLTLTRTATVCFAASGAKRAIGIGRVKTPVMSIICGREQERIDFKPQTYFEVQAGVDSEPGKVDLFCRGLPKTLQKSVLGVQDDEVEDDKVEAEDSDEALDDLEPLAGKLMDKAFVDKFAKNVIGHKPKLSMTSKKQTQSPPKLFDLTALQAAASSKMGWSGSKTLEIAQSLYETYKVTTYPRSEAQYLPEVEIGNVPKLLEALQAVPAYSGYSQLLDKPVIRKGKSGHFSDKSLEGMSHYAIIPNAAVADEMAKIVRSLPEDEAKMFDMIARRYMSALAPDYEYQKTDIWFFYPHPGPEGGKDHDWKFSTTGRIPLFQGWKEVAGKASGGKDDEEELPAIKNGMTGEVKETLILNRTTKPRPRFTDGTILMAMKKPGAFVSPEKAELRKMLEETEGIGRPSTRDSIVDGLVKQNLIARQKKELVPTPQGMSLWRMLRKVSPGLTDVVRTAVWETNFKKVLLGKLTAQEAVQKIIDETVKERDNLVEASKSHTEKIGKAAPPSPKAVMFVKKLAQMKGIEVSDKQLQDREFVYGFLNDHAPKEGETLPPSEPQLKFAKSIAERTGKEIPKDALTDGRAMKAWLDANVVSTPPSEKALAFAQSIAEGLGVKLPADASTSAKACSDFINKHKDKASKAGGKGRPKPKPKGAR